MKLILIFLTIRILDIISTYLCMSKYGAWETIEAAPMSKLLIGSVGYPWFIIINLFLSIAIALLLIKLNKANILVIFMVINVLVVLSNMLIFILI